MMKPNADGIGRIIFWMIALFVPLAVMLYMIDELNGIDYMLVSFQNVPNVEDAAELRTVLSSEAAPFGRSTSVNIANKYLSSVRASVYTCNETFIEITGGDMLSGRFIWERDALENKRYIVLGERAAVALFAGKNCVGEAVVLAGEEYTVIGVYDMKQGTLSAVDNFAVFLPLGSFMAANTRGGALLRNDDALSLKFKLQRVAALSGGITTLDDVRMRAKMAALPAKLVLFQVWVMTLVLAIRLLVRYVGSRRKVVAEEMKRLYLFEFISAHKWWIGLHVVILAMLIAVFCLTFRALSFTFEIDPVLIPTKLYDLATWRGNIAAYILTRNTQDSVLFSGALRVDVLGRTMLVLSVWFSIAAAAAARGLRLWLTGLVDYL